MGPCEIHKHHAHTIGPDGSLYACPGFAGEATQSTGHIDGRDEQWRRESAQRFEVITAWNECNDCAFIPVCAGGCSVAAHTELGDMQKPNCHKTSFEAGRGHAGATGGQRARSPRWPGNRTRFDNPGGSDEGGTRKKTGRRRGRCGPGW